MRRDLSHIKDVPVFFILGSARSGTSLLRLMLESHENIYIPLENPYILFLYTKYKKVYNWDEKKFTKLYKDLSYFRIFKLWNTDKDKLKEEILEYGSHASFQTLCKIIHTNYQSFQPKSEVKIIGDKNPFYSIFCKRIHLIFPDAKFIHIIRDYRGHALSVKKAGLFKPIFSSIVYRWKLQNKKIDQLKKTDPDIFCTIKYEDLVEDTVPVLQKICTFLNIEFKKEMATHLQRNLITAIYKKDHIQKFHSSLSEPINKSKKDEWKTELSKEQIKICDQIAGKYPEKYNYIREFEKFSLWFRLSHLGGIAYGYFIYPFLSLLWLMPINVVSVLIPYMMPKRKNI